MNPILSIVVPTKNRYFYLQNFVNSFVAFDSKEIELIIQDNSDIQSVEFLSYLKKIDDARIKYSYRNDWLSVVGNCDLGIDSASGEYVCMLGDDDGMLFDVSLDVVRFSKKNNFDAININKAEYYWPDTSHAVWKNLLSGNIFYKDYAFKTKMISVENELLKVLQEGAASSLRSLPRVYHGFVKREKLNELKIISGSFFPGPSPDMANAIGLSSIVKILVEIDVPAIISGHSKTSGGGMGAEKKHHGSIESQSFLPKDTSKLWCEKIPKFWSGATIYAESAKEALRRTNNPYQSKLNFAYLWAFCLVFESNYFKKIIPVILKKPFFIPFVLFHSFNLIIFRGFNFLKNYFKFNSKSKLSIPANNIYQAQLILNNLLGNKILFVSENNSTNI
jgi:glycosyltransferase involved in cell wall biosynthesis